jgi:hypothetical protein
MDKFHPSAVRLHYIGTSSEQTKLTDLPGELASTINGIAVTPPKKNSELASTLHVGQSLIDGTIRVVPIHCAA